MTKDESKRILSVLDSMALSLADHGHVWTKKQRRDYQRSVNTLNSSSVHICPFVLSGKAKFKTALELADMCCDCKINSPDQPDGQRFACGARLVAPRVGERKLK